MRQHPAYGQDNQDYIYPSYIKYSLILFCGRGEMDRTLGEFIARVRMTLSACLRKVLLVDIGIRIVCRKDIMDAMATGAVCHRSYAEFAGQPVIALQVSIDTILWQAVFGNYLLSAMALSARFLRNSRRIYR